MAVRSAQSAEIDHLARVWFDGWQEAHARILPAELTRIRTLESFRERLAVALPQVRVVGPFPVPVGFCILKGDELYQLYVSAQARGGGARPRSWPTPRPGSPSATWRSAGSPAPWATTEPPGSMRSAAGGVRERSAMRPRARWGCGSRCGATRSGCDRLMGFER